MFIIKHLYLDIVVPLQSTPPPPPPPPPTLYSSLLLGHSGDLYTDQQPQRPRELHMEKELQITAAPEPPSYVSHLYLSHHSPRGIHPAQKFPLNRKKNPQFVPMKSSKHGPPRPQGPNADINSPSKRWRRKIEMTTNEITVEVVLLARRWNNPIKARKDLL